MCGECTGTGRVGATCDDPSVAITSESRKRLWGRSGNRCAKCRAELVRPDENGLPGALLGEEAHIVAQSPGGARYAHLDPVVRDGYENLILLCANDHTEVDAQPSRYTVAHLRTMKRRHELWVATRLHVGPSDGAEPTLATLMRSGDDLWPLLHVALGWQVGTAEDLSDEEEDLIDGALQLFTDWCDISSDVEGQGFRAVREARRSLTSELNKLAEAGFFVLAGRREASFGGGAVTGAVVVLEVVRPEELQELHVPIDTAPSQP